MINAIAIDDETPALELLQHYCNKVDFLSLQQSFTVPSRALKYLRKYPVDIVFLDIQMPGMIGTEFCKRIDRDIMVVFTTGYGEYAVTGFNLDVVDFLHKPYSFERFEQAAKKIQQRYLKQQHGPETNPHIYLRTDYSLVKIPVNELLYMESLEDYTKFHFEEQQPIVIRITLKTLLEKLPKAHFLRIHRSYIVCIDKVEKVRNNSLFIKGKELNIGRVYRSDVMELIASR